MDPWLRGPMDIVNSAVLRVALDEVDLESINLEKVVEEHDLVVLT